MTRGETVQRCCFLKRGTYLEVESLQPCIIEKYLNKQFSIRIYITLVLDHVGLIWRGFSPEYEKKMDTCYIKSLSWDNL